MSSLLSSDDPTPRDNELELLQSMYFDEELVLNPDQPHAFVLSLSLASDVSLVINASLPSTFPQALPMFSCRSTAIHNKGIELLESKGKAHMQSLVDEGVENIFLELIHFLREEIEDQKEEAYSKESSSSSSESSNVNKKQRAENERLELIRAKNSKGFMREWCSFVALYKESYCSGPTRFEVLLGLAKDRGLGITGLGIGGKPGGIVIEGGEGDVEEFMRLLRTEFFETLNPRGRKCTTRWQERFPGDSINDEWEVACSMKRLEALLIEEGDGVKSKSKSERNEEIRKKEEDFINAYYNNKSNGKQQVERMTTERIDTLSSLTSPPPFEGELTEAEIDGFRIFPEFSILDSGDYSGSYQAAGALFKEMGRSDGFDTMFGYRFS
jgi:hypothetical protein